MSEPIPCKRCERMLPVSHFKADSRYRRGFTSWCHECHRQRNREWYAANKTRHNEKSNRWRKENPEKARDTWRAFHDRNKEARATQHAEWAKRNRDKRNATSARRKAAKLQATPKWVNWKKVREVYRQAKRLQEFTGVPMHVDHIVPLQGKNVCGLHWEGNLQVIPASQNCAKFNKWDDCVEEAYRQPDLFVPAPEKPVQEDFGI